MLSFLHCPTACGLTLAFLAGAMAVRADEAEGLAYFENHIRPLFSEHCYECHSAGAEKLKANLSLDSRPGWQTGGDSGPALIPGKPEDSLIYHAVSHKNGDLEMPPKTKLSEQEIGHLKHWISIGAPDPRDGQITRSRDKIDLKKGREFWSFQPPVNHPTPQVRQSAWPFNDIDRFILAKLEAKNLPPADDADQTTLLRRVYFDLIGLPPSPDELAAFQKDSSPNAFEKVVDHLLARPEFGERWGRHWLDVTRFAESSGGGRSLVFPDAWRFRDYVIASFNQDKPYDQLIREHLAGDLLDFKTNEQRNNQLIGSGYLVLGALNYELQDHELLKMEFVDEQIDAVGRSFLAMTLGCARCHDHKFDPIPTTDYYSLAGIFQSTESMGKGSAASGVTSFATTKLEITDDAEAVRIRAELATLADQITALKKQISPAKNPKAAESSLPGIVVDSTKAKVTGKWISSTHTKPWFGKDYLHDDNSGKGEKKVEFIAKLPRTQDYEVLIAYSATTNRAKNVPVTIRHARGETKITIDQSKPGQLAGGFLSVGTFPFQHDQPASVIISNHGTTSYVLADAVSFAPPLREYPKQGNEKKLKTELKSLEKQHKTLSGKLKKLQVVAMAPSEAEEIADGHVHIRGQVRNKGPKVPRGFITVAMAPGTSAAIPENHSGRLELAHWIADPDHPLTSRVMVNRIWKYLLGEGIVRTVDNLGSTGELPSHPELLDHLALRFSGNGWSIKSLIREITLSRTYQLSSKAAHHDDPENRLFGRAHRKRLEAEVIRDTVLLISGQLDRTRGGFTIRKAGQYDLNYKFNSNRRSIYVPWFRNSMLAILEVFDAPNPNLVVGRRPVTNLPTQALFLMNSPFIREQAKLTARQLRQSQATVDDAYLLILSRPPSKSERTTTTNFLAQFPEDEQDEAWAQICQTLLACVDFRFVD